MKMCSVEGCTKIWRDRVTSSVVFLKFLNPDGHNEGCVAVDDFKATEKGQLSVAKGQRLEVVEHCGDSPEWVLVSITWENGEQQRGLVPCSVISSIEPADVDDILE
ncbi:unnamed protein product [Litomosoides sigmodontis]|uniref:SH3 domain-containing protein n=1 Tax=Litomosoides sigmodontis TaxID=42156 RepID=A0A3P6SDW6_LITSI|nr:unnamed protein product [Litomosoides sigmodontis]